MKNKRRSLFVIALCFTLGAAFFGGKVHHARAMQPIDGSGGADGCCDSTHYLCLGTGSGCSGRAATSKVQTSTDYTWTCPATTGGAADYCDEPIPQPINGACNNGTQYSCSAGVVANQHTTCANGSGCNPVDGYGWDCNGTGGGSNATGCYQWLTPTASMRAVSTSVSYGGATTLYFSALHINSCTETYDDALGTHTGTGGYVNGTDAYSISTGPLYYTTTFHWSCCGAITCPPMSSVTVSVPSPINGACYGAAYGCTSGTSINNSTNSTQFTWQCQGSNGGSTASCTDNLASCGVNYYTCNVGTPSLMSGQGSQANGAVYTWTCTYTPSITSQAGCYQNFAGACAYSGSGVYRCDVGNSTNNVQSASQWTWNCMGGGSAGNASCSYPITQCGGSVNTCTAGGTASGLADMGSYYSWSCTLAGLGYSATGCTQNKPPVDGSCGSGVYGCGQGSLANATSPSQGYYTWNCNGLYGGATASCSTYQAVNGACNSSAYGCNAGVSASPSNNTTSCVYSWNCNGLYGGSSTGCTQPYACSGVCAATHYNCQTSSGATNASYNASTYLYSWTCPGPNGGSAAGCSEGVCTAGVCGGSPYACAIGPSVNNSNPSQGTYTWNCNGFNGCGSAYCTYVVPPSVTVSAPTTNGGGSGSAYDGEAPSVTWTATNVPTTCYIYRNGAYVTSVSGGTTSYNIGAISSGSVSYRVDCVNAGGTGTGNTVTFSVPYPPSNLSATCGGSGNSASFSWSLPGGISGIYFRYYHSPPSYADYTTACTLGNTPPAGSCNNVDGLSTSAATTPGTNYYWYIHSRDAYGNWSPAVGAAFSCSLNAACTPGSTSYGCNAGTSSGGSYNPATFTYSWTCNGINGGSNIGCSYAVPTAGVCIAGSTTYGCSTGSSSGGSYNAGTYTYTWTCGGVNGGSATGCTYAVPTAGVCGSSSYTCSVGTDVNNANPSTGTYTWNCNGYNGGSNTGCTLVNGTCNATAYSCISGTDTGNSNPSTGTYTWSCTGSGGGSTAGCTLVNGTCSSPQTHYTCLAGASASNSSNTTTWTWNCNGSGGGSNIGCSETKPNPAAPTLGGPTSGAISTSYSFTFQASDPLGSTLRYDIDWDNNGTVDAYLPTSGYTTSNTQLSTNNNWGGSGTKYFKAYTETSDGRTSGWTSFNGGAGIVIHDKPVISLSAAATTINYNTTASITWTSSDATSCSLTQAGSAWQSALSGTNVTGATLTADTVYALSCTGVGGTSNQSITIQVRPNVALSVAASPISYNTGTTVTWSSNNASTCSVTANGSAWQSGTSGSAVATGNLLTSTTYALTCTSPSGAQQSTSQVVTVNPYPGVCAATHYNCVSSIAATNQINGPTTWTWTCPGANGGGSPGCSETKQPPTTPTLVAGPTDLGVSLSGNFTVSANDTAGDNIRYAIDWTNTGTTTGNTYLPNATTYVAPGTQETTANNWAGSGMKYFMVRAETQGGLVSGWLTVPVHVWDTPTVTWSPGPSATVGYNGTLSFSYTSTNASTCSYYDVSVSTGTTTEINVGHATTSSWTNAGPYQQDFKRRVVCQNPLSVSSPQTDMYVTVGQNGSSCGTFSFPTYYVEPSASFSGTITMNNTLTNTWYNTSTNGGTHRLQSQTPPDNTTWGTNRINMTQSSVAQSATGTFTTTFTAPATSGDYGFAWDMVEDFATSSLSFGPTCTPTTPNGSVIRVMPKTLAVNNSTSTSASLGFPDTIAYDPPSKAYLHLSNLGGGTISGGTVTGLSGAFSAPTTTFALGPGASQDLEFDFAPTATGTVGENVTVTAPGQPSFTVNLFGAGKDKFVFANNPNASATIDPVISGDATTLRPHYFWVTIKNNSLSQSGGTNVKVTPNGPFSCVDTASVQCTPASSGFSLPPSSSSTVSSVLLKLKFAPTAVGTWTNVPLVLSTTPPITIHVSGNGVAPVYSTHEK